MRGVGVGMGMAVGVEGVPSGFRKEGGTWVTGRGALQNIRKERRLGRVGGV